MQLVAYGAQDIYLTGNPMITYFKVVYRRHTNFAMESIQQTFNGSIGWGKRVTALISRNGDLVSGMTLEITLPNLTTAARNDEVIRWSVDVGHYIATQMEIEIGGQLIDRHFDDWLEIWAQLTVTADKKLGYLTMIGQDPIDATGGTFTGLQLGATVPNAGGQAGVAQTLTGRKIFVPLQFWFCRNVGLALPLIALQYHEVKVNIQFNEAINLYQRDGVANPPGTATIGELRDVALWVDYIYLDTDERRRFAQVSHEYLIEQLQMNQDTYANGANTKSISLNFNHPVKELVWVCADTMNNVRNNPGRFILGSEELTAKDNYANANTNGTNPIRFAKLILNGHDRFAERVGSYFNKVQPYQYHSCIPDSPGINVYSFALKPEEHQPSGTCNFSRIDNAKLQITTLAAARGGNIIVFATNYNVLRVMSGMGGLAYSN
jgi:hypothetical protein